jgi:hypothetical protein
VAPLERKNEPIVVNDTTLVCSKKKRKLKKLFLFLKNDHGVDVSMIIVIYFTHIENNFILNHSHQIHL